MADTITHKIGTAGAPSRDYSTISAWVAAQQRDLVNADEIEQGECYNDGEMTDNATIDGFTTDSTRYVRLYAPDAQRRSSLDPLRYGYGFRVVNTSNYKDTLNVADNYTRIEGLELKNTAGTAGSGYAVLNLNADNLQVSDCILTNPGGDHQGLRVSYAGTMNVWNTLIYDLQRVGLVIYVAATLFFDNITIHGATSHGVQSANQAGTATMKNVVSMGNGGDDFLKGAAFTFNVTYCCSEDDTADDWGGDGNLALDDPGSDEDQFVSVTGGSEDFTVKDTDADIHEAGTDSPSSSFTDDINRDTRVAPWDIGCEELIAAAAGVEIFRRRIEGY